MPRERLLVAVLAAIALLALAAGAASLADPVQVGGGGGDEADPDDPSQGSGNATGWDVEPINTSLFGAFTQGSPPSICVEPLYEAGPLAVIVLILLAAAVLWWATSALLAIAAAFGAGPFLLLLYGILTIGCRTRQERPPPSEGGNPTDVGGSLGDGWGGATADQAVQVATDPLVILLGLALVGALAAVIALRRTGEEEHPDRPAGSSGEGDASDLARIAGHAADRLDDADDATLDNEVFRAWRRMTDVLDVASPGTATPGQFADAAIAAGLDASDVRDLTALFEAVRYGDRPPTPDRERRAVATLRRIERQYGGEGP